MADVARLAGVSRITVHRRFATKDVLVEQVVRREVRRYFDRFIVDIQGARTVADRVVLGFASSLRAIRRNPLIGGLPAAEPGAAVPSMTSDGGRTLAAVRQFVAERLRREQQAGNAADGVDVDLVAEMTVRVSVSFLVIPTHVVDLDDEEPGGCGGPEVPRPDARATAPRSPVALAVPGPGRRGSGRPEPPSVPAGRRPPGRRNAGQPIPAAARARPAKAREHVRRRQGKSSYWRRVNIADAMSPCFRGAWVDA
nr:TetR/AcrR family transcriptional regulator [Streptomyces cyaneogriseus]